MNLNGEYVEKMKCGAELHVSKSDWYLRFYFPGPDLRHNGEFLTIPGNQMLDFISAYKSNFATYLKLKESIPANGSFTQNGMMGMKININGYFNGVCIKSYHLPINTQDKLNEILTEFQEVIIKSKKILTLLNNSTI
jgi:hypothetical protein